ncbi:MAG: hypothetical protein JWN22_1606 [Nocardioides sp.]|jgi:hypothetical protein|nr:hypothetical protein [Nocardioides sp.]
MTSERDLDAPKPPGGPQRGDAPDGPKTPDGRDERDTPGDDDRDLQEENAETSLDQPST